jgi:hypothetical protein
MGPCRPEDHNRPNGARRITTASSDGGDPQQQQHQHGALEEQPTPGGIDDTEGFVADGSVANNSPELVNPLQAQQDAWAVSEGYTPLADLTGGSGGDGTFLMMSMGPGGDSSSDSEDEEEDDHNAARATNGETFVNLSGFRVSNDDDRRYETNQNHLNPSLASDFGDTAARALLSLDEDYRNCLQPVADESGDQQSKFENAQENDMEDNDEDIKIIAAAFDKRNEEMQQIQKEERFPVDWDGMVKSNQNLQEMKKNLDVDTEAVKKAVQALSLRNKDARFQQKFETWQQKQKGTKAADVVPKHALIPAAPMKAFHRSTLKAKKATANLTRSATLAEAIVRLLIIDPSCPLLSTDGDNKTLLIDIVGVDHVECSSAQRIQGTFRPIVRWLASFPRLAYDKVHFRMIGRDLTKDQCHPVDFLSTTGASEGHSSVSSSLKTAIATCHSGVYHEFLEDLETAHDKVEGERIAPDLAIAFNAGIWGYQEWLTTIKYLAKPKQPAIPFVITAYTHSECQEDYSAISNAVGAGESEDFSQSFSAHSLWKPELNPYGSQVVRDTKSSKDEYRENSSWQAWLLGAW